MKRILIIFTLVFLSVALVGCGSSDDPKEPRLQVVGEITTGKTSYGRPYYAGTVENTGDGTAYNASIEFTIYEDESKTKILGTAWDYLADGADIGPGQSTDFEAIALNLTSIDQLKYYSIKITRLTR